MNRRFALILTAILLSVIPFAIFAQAAQVTNPFSLNRSGATEVSLHFELPAFELVESQVKGETLTKVKIENTPYLFIDETETLPVFSTLIAIPYNGGVSLQTLSQTPASEYRAKLDFDGLLKEESRNGKLYPENGIQLSEPQILRDYRVVSLNVYPFQYDKATGKLIVQRSLDIRLSFDANAGVNEMNAPNAISQSFESIYRGNILNYESLINRETIYQAPRMLVIYGNFSDPIYLGKVNEYVAWKRQKGYIVNAVSTATTGTTTTTIKNYIQTQYDNVNTRPDYLVLIGDTSGNMPVVTFNTYQDYEYTLLAGNDNLGDVVIGRISVENTEQFTNYIAKLMSLEQNINASTASWLNRMVLVGDTASSGISTIYTNQYISDLATEVNPDYTYATEYSGSPSSANINTAINTGVAFYNYRGYIGMSGWPSTMSNMYNGSKLFHAVFITCNTGSFGGSTSTTESVVRYGSAATLGGAVTAIGMATSSTHTPMNNCLNVGIFHNIFPQGGREMGTAMLNGKIYLYSVYGVSNLTQANSFSRFCNLIGDPTAAVYVGPPDIFIVDSPSSIPAGTSTLRIGVKDSSNQPLAGASVAITNSSDMQVIGFTDASGYVVLEIAQTLSGSLTLSVSKDDFKPAVSTIAIDTAGGLVYDSVVVDDDSAGGNGDGIINAGEQVNLYLTVQNTSASTVFLSGEAFCTDPYITLIEYDRIEFNSIAPGAYGENLNPITLSVAANCPDNHDFYLRFEVEASGNNWSLFVPLTVRSGNLEIQSFSFVGSTGNILNPGASYPLTISLKNTGAMNLSSIQASLRSYDTYLVLPDSLGNYGNINVNSTVANGSNSFQVQARATCIEGMVIPMELLVYNSSGFSQTLPFSITIGQVSSSDPLGQDAYGYFIFDETDTGYPQSPSYQWIPIAPAEGGSGTILALTDPGNHSDEGDQVGAVSITTVTLPFTFNFYGRSYTTASISSNGFISFGHTQNSDWRNWRLPGPGGPNPMVAVFWDDLLLDANSGVYTYYNSASHYYVVEWYNLLSGYDMTTREHFQAILYDPVFYPTQTNDGQIKLQYRLFNNVDLGSGDTYPHGNFCTIGIKDHNGLSGLEYTFNNSYPTAAVPLANEKALFVTTRPILSENPYLTVQQTNILDANGNAHLEPGENSALEIVIRNSGLANATNVNATLSSTDPYVTITNGYAAYGTISGEGSASPQTNYGITVSPSAPLGHQLVFNLSINGSSQNWVYEVRLNVYTPVLELGSFSVLDHQGNSNGTLDPGETVVLRIPLENNGEVASPAGTISIACSNPGLSFSANQLSFSVLSPGSQQNMDFTLTASAAINIGTLVTCDISVSSGIYTLQEALSIEVGAPTVISIGTGTSSQSYPLDRYYNYSAHEAIYLASEIAMAGNIKSIGFYKANGGDVNVIEAVSIYLKHTTASTQSNGDYSLDGYTLVFSGNYPNTAESGWMEVDLNNMFSYNGTQNLSMLVVKGYQQWINNYPNWTYTSTATARVRQNRSDSAAPTSLSTSNNLPNLMLKVFPAPPPLYPAQNLNAVAGFRQVDLSWEAPISGSPITYKIYRDGALLTSVNALAYSDVNVVNGQSYSYYIKAAYGSGDSEPTTTVMATPLAYPAQNLLGIGSSNLVTLSWEAPSVGTPLSYNIYRNGSLFASEPGLNFYDVDVELGTQYNYYVKAQYQGEESAATATVSITPANPEVTYVVQGTETNLTTNRQNSPINTANRSVHGQSVYLASELNAAGVFGPMFITELGFYVDTAPTQSLPDFAVRMKHTGATNAASWHDSDGLQTVYTSASYQPVAGGYDMLVLSQPFLWNGTDNILVDSAFNLVSAAAYSGTVQYTYTTSGYRFAWSNLADQTQVFSGGVTVNRRPNLRVKCQNQLPNDANLGVNPSFVNFSAVEVGTVQTRQISVSNSGNGLLTGYFSLPAGYQISVQRAENFGTGNQNWDRDNLRFLLNGAGSLDFLLSFSPTEESSYNGNMTIVSNAQSNPSHDVPLTGSGILPTLATPVVSVQNSGSNLILNWAAVPQAAIYQVYKASSPEGPFTLVGSTSLLQFNDTASDKAFYYVKALTAPVSKASE